MIAMTMNIATTKNPTVHILLMSTLAMITSTAKNQSACFVPLSMLAMTTTRTMSIIAVMNSKRSMSQISIPATTISMATARLIQSQNCRYLSRTHCLITMSRKSNASKNTKRKRVDITSRLRQIAAGETAMVP